MRTPAKLNAALTIQLQREEIAGLRFVLKAVIYTSAVTHILLIGALLFY